MKERQWLAYLDDSLSVKTSSISGLVVNVVDSLSQQTVHVGNQFGIKDVSLQVEVCIPVAEFFLGT